MTEHERDIPPDNGKRPPFAEAPEPARGKIGTGDGYSGQEYDSAGQADWRAREDRKALDPSGEVHGSGVGDGDGGRREDFDPGTSGAQAVPASKPAD